jgi:hypothetical protein
MPINSCRLILHLRILNKSKGHPRTGHEGPQSEKRYNTTIPLTSTLEEGGWSKPRPDRVTPEKNPVPIGWAPGPVWTSVLISPTPGFDPRTIRPVQSRYADYTIPAHMWDNLHYSAGIRLALSNGPIALNPKMEADPTSYFF